MILPILSTPLKIVSNEAKNTIDYDLIDKISNNFIMKYLVITRKHSNREFKENKNLKIEAKIIYDKYGLSDEADILTVKKRFRALAKMYHPDMLDGDEKKFIELREDMNLLISYINDKQNVN